MIVIGQQQHLGKRTFMLFLSRRVTPGGVLFIMSVALAFIGPSLLTSVGKLLAQGGSFDQSVVSNLSGYASYFTVALLLASIILMMVGVIIALTQYRNHVFILDEFSLKMKHGLLNQLEISIPYRQIQDINLVRTVHHRLFGVSRLIMITAGHEDAKENDQTDTVFDPIDADIAQEIKQFLERRIGVQVIKQDNA